MLSISSPQSQINPLQAQESRVRDFYALLKPRVMSLVIFTGMVGMVIAPGTLHPVLLGVAILCIALGSGAAGAMNMWIERDIDAKMQRTRHRPLPAGRINEHSALEFAVIMAFASVFVMAFAINYMAAALLFLAMMFYVFVYTIWLKPRTPQNIVIGGAAGAFPPMIGWAAVTGTITWESVILFAIIFMWTPPHFWALALYKSGDYEKAGIPMLPVIAGRQTTQKHIVIYAFLLYLTSLVPCLTGMFSTIYMVAALTMGGRFVYLCYKLYRSYSENLARKVFVYSILYLFLLFLVMMVDHWVVRYVV